MVQWATSVFARSLSARVQPLSLLWFHVHGDTATVISISPSSINSDPGALHRTRASLIRGFSFLLKSQDFSPRLLHHGFFCVSLLVEALSAGLQVACHRAALYVVVVWECPWWGGEPSLLLLWELSSLEV